MPLALSKDGTMLLFSGRQVRILLAPGDWLLCDVRRNAKSAPHRSVAALSWTSLKKHRVLHLHRDGFDPFAYAVSVRERIGQIP